MIFVSAGHHPASPGAKWERFIEHDEAVIWSHELAACIGNDCLEVPTGVLRDKVDFINSRIMNGDIAIEIHFNAARNAADEPIGNGCETLYYPGSIRGKSLATLCQTALAASYPPSRGVKEGWYRMNPEKGPDFFLAKTKCPAVILEPEFVHHSELIENNREAAVIDLAAALIEGV